MKFFAKLVLQKGYVIFSIGIIILGELSLGDGPCLSISPPVWTAPNASRTLSGSGSRRRAATASAKSVNSSGSISMKIIYGTPD